MSPELKDSWNYGRGSRIMMGLIFPLTGEELTCEDGAREEERSGEMKSNSESRMGKRTGNTRTLRLQWPARNKVENI